MPAEIAGEGNNDIDYVFEDIMAVGGKFEGEEAGLAAIMARPWQYGFLCYCFCLANFGLIKNIMTCKWAFIN